VDRTGRPALSDLGWASTWKFTDVLQWTIEAFARLVHRIPKRDPAAIPDRCSLPANEIFSVDVIYGHNIMARAPTGSPSGPDQVSRAGKQAGA